MNKRHHRQATMAAVAAFIAVLFGAAVLDACNTWFATRSELMAVARSIDERSKVVRQESLDLADQMSNDDVCDRAELRRLIRQSSYVRNIGKIRGTRIVCDALDGSNASIELGKPQVVRADGLRIWMRPWSIWAALGPNALVIDPGSFVDALLPADTTVMSIEAQSGQLFAHSEPLPKSIAPAAWHAGPGMLIEAGYLVAVSRSTDKRTLELAARPLTSVTVAAVNSLPRFLLAGALFGLVLAFAVYTAMSRHRSLISELRRALKARRLHVALQPIVRIDAGKPRVVGFESLARWELPDGEEIPPAVFVPMIENAGLGSQLAACMATNIARDFGATLRAHPDLYVALNLSSADVADQRLLDEIDRTFATHGIPSKQVVIELTERTFEAEGLAEGLARLRESGHRLSIDDFGTGASNASRLATFHPELVKVDRSFLVHADCDGPAAGLLSQLVAMAYGCGAEVVIEGVETGRQAERLSHFGPVLGQGFFWHRPMNPLEAATLLAREDALEMRHPPAEAAPPITGPAKRNARAG